jgi:NADH-quinone oxidoreductase subunit A
MEFLNSSIVPLIVYAAGILILVGAMLGLSYVLGERHSERQTNEPYESGIQTTGNGNVRFSAKFYLASMFFVIFDLESVFIYAYSTSVKELGWHGFIQILFFSVFLMLALVYLWRTGGLNFGPNLRKPRTQLNRIHKTL